MLNCEFKNVSSNLTVSRIENKKMKLINKKLKKIFGENKILVFVPIKRFDSFKLLKLKNKLLNEKIEFKVISNKNLKQFFCNIENKKFLNFFQGDIIILYSQKLDWFLKFNNLKKILENVENCFLYQQQRFFLISNLILRSYNDTFINFLKKQLVSRLLKFLLNGNRVLMKLFLHQKSFLINILKEIKNEKI